jgi:uncharacterized damage-inducible protein DinB
MNADQATFLVNYIANQLEQEVPTTVKVLSAVGQGDRDYRPDAKSRTAWELAVHIATSDVWFLQSIVDGKFAYDPEAAKQQEAQFKSVDDVVAYYQREVPDRLKRLRALPADKLTEEVDFFGVMKAPNASFLGIANNHGIHHRGQLAAYLRAMGSKVPSIYGGSADEPFTGAA